MIRDLNIEFFPRVWDPGMGHHSADQLIGEFVFVARAEMILKTSSCLKAVRMLSQGSARTASSSLMLAG